MPTDDTFREIDAAAATLGLTIAPDWKPNVQMFFEVARGMAKMIDAKMNDATGTAVTEAAPVFTPDVFSPGAGQ